jgi:sugar lactone lactonase YvrE
MRRTTFFALLLAGALLVPAGVAAQPFPTTVPLPNGFAPEGIAIGGSTFYTGSLAGAGIYRGDLVTGQGATIAPSDGRTFVGMKLDPWGRLWVAGGPAGEAYVFDARNGDELATIGLPTLTDTFINDVVITPDAAWFTDSFRPAIYRVALGPDGAIGDVTLVDLTGEIAFEPGQFNLNGIDATADGATLLTVNSFTGDLYTIDAASETVAAVDLGDGSLTNGDGILLAGHTLYVGRNANNEVAVVSLAPDLASGAVGQPITASGFDFPTTLARFGRTLYVVNARFATPVTPDTEYWLTAVTR